MFYLIFIIISMDEIESSLKAFSYTSVLIFFYKFQELEKILVNQKQLLPWEYIFFI